MMQVCVTIGSAVLRALILIGAWKTLREVWSDLKARISERSERSDLDPRSK
jgi:hypothetical protein